LFQKEEIAPELRSRVASNQWAEYEFAKVLNASSLKIDFDLPPEPLHYRDTFPEKCGEESMKWKEAMDDEIASMKAFGVYERVPKSVAQGRQILGCKCGFIREKLARMVKLRATVPDWLLKVFVRKNGTHLIQMR
jgi:hypothetical protein